MLHLYTGNGKGKTTSALGMCLRARGRGLKVVFIQFMKNRDTGELISLEKLGVDIRRCDKNFPFAKKMTKEEKREITQIHNTFLDDLDDYDLIVLDEVNVALHYNLLDENKLLNLLKEGRGEIILTGRYAKAHIISMCHYVTNMEKISHPLDEKIGAREGIEY